MSAVAPCSFEKSDNAIKSMGAIYIAIKDMKELRDCAVGMLLA
jgi:hypothetical protein